MSGKEKSGAGAMDRDTERRLFMSAAASGMAMALGAAGLMTPSRSFYHEPEPRTTRKPTPGTSAKAKQSKAQRNARKANRRNRK